MRPLSSFDHRPQRSDLHASAATLAVLGALSLAACRTGAEPAPHAASAAQPAAGAPAANAAAPGASGPYAMCGGQLHEPGATSAPRSGPVQVQLAPAFLDEMATCQPDDGVPRALIARASEGHIDASGDCEFADIGVTCHYHSGSEFINSSVHQQTLGQGELHCIFPGDDAKSPRVYGGHVMCKEHGQGEPHGEPVSHEVHSGAACSPGLLHQLESCKQLRCCDDGTLTNPIAELFQSHRNDVRPDFRICDDTLEVDCALLAALTGHGAHSPALGGVGAPAFAVEAGASGAKPALQRQQ